MRIIRRCLAIGGLIASLSATAPNVANANGNNWSGLYIGASVGGLGADIDWTYPNGTKPQPIDVSNALVAGHVGIQHQFNRFVLGLEGTWGGTHAFGGNDLEGGSCPNPTFNCLGRLHSIMTIGPRLGWTPTDRWMLYMTGGYATGRLETLTRNAASGATFDQSNSRHDGWFIGGGIEYALNRNWYVGVEYQHIELDERNVGATPFFASETRNGLNADVDIIRGRLTFKLGRPEAHHVSLK